MILKRFDNLSRFELAEAADRSRVQIIEAMMSGRIRAMDGDSNGAVIGYVRRVVENAARDVYRERHATGPLLEHDDLSSSESNPHAFAVEREMVDRAKRLMNSWPEPDRFIFELKTARVSARAIQTDLKLHFGLFITTQGVDTRFSRLRARIEQECFGR